MPADPSRIATRHLAATKAPASQAAAGDLAKELEIAMEEFKTSKAWCQLPLLNAVACEYEGLLTYGATKMIVVGQPLLSAKKDRLLVVFLKVDRITHGGVSS